MKVEELTLEERDLLKGKVGMSKLTLEERDLLVDIIDELASDFKRTYNEVSESILLMEDKESYLNEVIDSYEYIVNGQRLITLNFIKSKEAINILNAVLKYNNYLAINKFKKLLK